MKNLIEISKRSIAAILTLCIFLGITGTCVYAVAMPEETTATEETTQELVPVMTTRCAHTCNYTEPAATVRVICDRCGGYIEEYYARCSCGNVERTGIYHKCFP